MKRVISIAYQFLIIHILNINSVYADLMTADDMLAFTSPPADAVFSYGNDDNQFGELRLSDNTAEQLPVVIIIHGGCYLSKYGVDYMGQFARAVSQLGFASWSIEYRRVGNAGGGWPGTFEDVANAADYLRVLARSYPLDLDRVTALGHSSGGQLAMWLAKRNVLTADETFYDENSIPIKNVIALAPVLDIALRYRQGNCDNSAAKLMGGSPLDVAKRYEQVSPVEMLPIGTRQVILLGQLDTKSRHEESRSYLRKAALYKEEIEMIYVPDSGHFEYISPETSAWLYIKNTLEPLLTR